jgi:pyruvate-formate lyase-activating enzyme
VEIALVSLHQWEEPCLSGTNGAGTVFFSHCNMRCIFCQNHEISTEGKGFPVTIERLAQIFLEQQVWKRIITIVCTCFLIFLSLTQFEHWDIVRTGMYYKNFMDFILQQPEHMQQMREL